MASGETREEGDAPKVGRMVVGNGESCICVGEGCSNRRGHRCPKGGCPTEFHLYRVSSLRDSWSTSGSPHIQQSLVLNESSRDWSYFRNHVFQKRPDARFTRAGFIEDLGFEEEEMRTGIPVRQWIPQVRLLSSGRRCSVGRQSKTTAHRLGASPG